MGLAAIDGLRAVAEAAVAVCTCPAPKELDALVAALKRAGYEVGTTQTAP